LDFNKIDILIAQLNDAFQYGLDFGKFVLVAGYEVEVLGCCHGDWEVNGTVWF